MTKSFIAFRLFFMIINLLQILVKKLISSILLLQNRAKLLKITMFYHHQPLHKKWSFPLRISSVNVTKSAVQWTNPITNQYLWNIESTKDDIKKIICKFDPNKNHDIISICMLKMPGNAIIEPLFTIFKNRLKYGIFPDYWKKGNTASISKKSDKQNIKNFHPVSLLPVFSKVFGRIIYDIILK